MRRCCGFFAAALAATMLLCQCAEAGSRVRKDDPRLTVTGVAVGAGTTAGYLALRDWRWRNPSHPKVSNTGAVALTTVGCMALSPIISTIVVQRELTLREAYVMTADCVIPFVGGWLMNKAFDDHPEWEARGKRARKR